MPPKTRRTTVQVREEPPVTRSRERKQKVEKEIPFEIKTSTPPEKTRNGPISPSLIYPSGDTAIKILLMARFCAAIGSYITDCDETYNYWEPGHFLLYGTGQQTWEYSPQYALRSYAYLLLHMVPAKIYWYLLSLFYAEPNPMHVFYSVRCLLSIASSIAEVYFYSNVCKEFGVHVGRMTLAFMVFSSGMFISSTAFLPSSFSMYFSTAAMGAWFGRKYELGIFYTAISALLGWPFAALLGLPMAIELLFRRKEWFTFFSWTLISGAVVLGPMIMIDSIYYGKLTIAPLNIIKYNVFTSHGPDLYGTEPFTYYLVNGFLNFNFIFVWSLLTPGFLMLAHNVLPPKMIHQNRLPYWYSLAPLYLWFLVFFFQPHKEERFLFPVYPLICLHGAITIDTVQKLYFYVKSRVFNYALSVSNNYLQCTKYIMVFAILITSCFGISRTYALYKGYHAPMDVMAEANRLGIEGQIPRNVDINFCVGKEWHRFPSSFFFPSNTWRLKYVQSEFKGQLPQAYANHPNATSIIQPNFNDQNKEEPTRYFPVDKCHLLLDLDVGRITELEPNYSHLKSRFTILKTVKFLDNVKSHPLYRAFYIPYKSDEYCAFGSYNLLQNVKYKFPK